MRRFQHQHLYSALGCMQLEQLPTYGGSSLSGVSRTSILYVNAVEQYSCASELTVKMLEVVAPVINCMTSITEIC